MLTRHFIPGIVWTVGLASCVPQAPVTNPYDPALPAAQQAKAQITGTVMLAGANAEASTFLANATVQLSSPEQATPTVVSSDAHGIYLFANLTPGIYVLKGTFPSAYPEPMTVSVAAGQTLQQGLTLTAIAAGSSGSLVAHLTGVAQKGGQGALPAQQDHSGIVVQLAGQGIRTMTNVHGDYDFFVAPGIYTVQFDAANYAEQSVAGIALDANSTTTLDPVVMVPTPGTLSGNVQLEGVASGQWGGVTLSVPGQPVTTSASDGSFQLSVPAGTYTLTASLSGAVAGHTYDRASVAGVAVQGGASTAVGALPLSMARGTLVGTVQLIGSADASGVVVNLSGQPYTATTGANGAFVLTGVPAGSYNLVARLAGYITTAPTAVTVGASSTSSVPDLALTPLQGNFSINAGASFTNSAAVTVSFPTQSGITGMRVSQDGNFATPSLGDVNYRVAASSAAFTLSSGDGPKTLYAQYQDQASVDSAVYTRSIVLDTAPPVAFPGNTSMLLIDSGSAYSNTAAGLVSLQFSATDALSGVDSVALGSSPVLNSGNFVPYATPMVYSISPSTDGSKTIYAFFRDHAGNVTAAQSASITLDTTPPTLSSFAFNCPGNPLPTSLCNASVVNLQVGSADAVQIKIANDTGLTNATLQTFQGPVMQIAWLLSPGDGAHSVSFVLLDSAGNATATNTYPISVDTQPPTSPSLQITGDSAFSPGYTHSASVGLVLAASGATQMQISNCADFSASGAGCNTTAWVTQAPTLANWNTSAAPGNNTVYAQFRDAALNLSAVATASIILDTVAPTLGVPAVSILANPNNFTNSLSALVSLAASGADFMSVACNGSNPNSQPALAYSTAVDCLLPSGDGQKAVNAQFFDLAGNAAPAGQGALTTGWVYYDATPPTSPSISTAAAIVAPSTHAVSLGVQSSDAALLSGEPGGPRFVYQLKGGQYGDWTDCGSALTNIGWAQDAACSGPPGDFAFTLARGDNRLSVRARDRAGNVSAEDTVVVTQDNVAPGLVLHQNADGSTAAWGSTDVESGDGYTIVTWEPPADADIAGYYLYYGFVNSADPNAYTGSFANQGASPINLGRPCTATPGANDCAIRLTGLANGNGYYVSLAAFDKTTLPGPNVGALVPAQSTTPAPIVPTLVSTLPAASLSAAAGTFVRGVAVRDGLAYVTSGDGGNLAIVDLANPAQPHILSMSSAPLTRGHGLVVAGTYAYVADGISGLKTFDIINPSATPALVATNTLAAGQEATSVVAQQDLLFVVGDDASVAANSAIYIFSTAQGTCAASGLPSAPATPCQIATISLSSTRYVDVAVQENRLYAAWSGGLNVYDISNPLSPALLGGTSSVIQYTSGVTVSGETAYLAAGQSIVAINLGATLSLESVVGTVNQVYRVAVQGGVAYANGLKGLEVAAANLSNSATSMVSGYSISNLTYNDPLLNSSAPYPGMIAVSGNFVHVAAHALGLMIYRSTAVRSVEVASTYTPPADPLNLNMAGNLLLYTARNQSGLDETDLLYANTAALSVANSNTLSNVGEPLRAKFDNGALVFTDNLYGNVISKQIALTSQYKPALVDACSSCTPYTPTGFHALGLALRWPYAYVSGSDSTTENPNMLRVLDLQTQTAVGEARFTGLSSSGPTYGVALYGNHAYVTNGSTTPNLFIIDISSPTSPATVASLSLPYILQDIVASGTRLYVAHSNGLRVLSLTGAGSPLAPVDVGGYAEDGVGDGFAVSGNYVYLGAVGIIAGSSVNWIDILDASDPANPRLLVEFESGIDAQALVPANNSLFVANSGLPLQALRLK